MMPEPLSTIKRPADFRTHGGKEPVWDEQLMIGIEAIAAAWGWKSLAKIGAAPRLPSLDSADLLGLVVMAVSVLACSAFPIWITSVVGATAFFATRITLQALRPKHSMAEAAQ